MDYKNIAEFYSWQNEKLKKELEEARRKIEELEHKEKEKSKRRYLLSKLKKQALKRDGNKCKECGAKGKLHMHHIKPEDNLESVIILCVFCHAEKHKEIANFIIAQ